MKYSFDNYSEFLDNIFSGLEEKGVDVSDLYLDHIAYRATTKEEYEKVKESISDLGELVAENMIRNRPIAKYKLYKVLEYKGRQINCLEVISPAEGDEFESGLEHAEFVIKDDLHDFAKRYARLEFIDKTQDRKINQEIVLKLGNGLAVKFHNHPLLEVVESERIQK